MKRSLALLIISSVIAVILCGCSGGENKTTENSTVQENKPSAADAEKAKVLRAAVRLFHQFSPENDENTPPDAYVATGIRQLNDYYTKYTACRCFIKAAADEKERGEVYASEPKETVTFSYDNAEVVIEENNYIEDIGAAIENLKKQPRAPDTIL